MCEPSSFKSPLLPLPDSSSTLEQDDISNIIEYVLARSQTKKSEVLDFSAHLIYTTALFVCRLSGLAFYRRLCKLHDRLYMAIKCALLAHIAAYLPQVFLIILHCKPVTGLWPYS
jgi:hypothetical protein